MLRNLLSVICLLFLFTFSKAEIPQSEKQALYAIATSIQTPFNWNEQTPVEQWEGVTISIVNGSEHVIGLNIYCRIPGQNSTINFSNQISQLIYLEDLELYYGFITTGGNVFNFNFQDLVNLAHLRKISITKSSSLRSNDELQNLHLISQISSLEDLNIEINSTKIKVPDSVALLTSLKSLSYVNGSDETISPSIFENTFLEKIKVETGVSFLNGMPSSFSHLVNLKTLQIGGKFLELPACFFTIPNLEELGFNAPQYYLPASLENYAGTLKKLSITNTLYGNVWKLGQLYNLESFFLSANSDIFVDDSLVNLTKLKELYLRTEYTLNITDKLSQMNSLESVYILTPNAPIASKIFTIPNPKLLVLGTNSSLSEEVGNLHSLQHLQVQINGNVSSIPKSIGNNPNLEKIDFIIAGTVPSNHVTLPSEYFTNWPNLQQFWSQLNIVADLTNKFLNSPYLVNLDFNSYYGQPGLTGKLNLCQNPNLNLVRFFNSNIEEVDLRNIQGVSDGTILRLRFEGNTVSKFIVDDVNQFNTLLAEGKIVVSGNIPANYTVITSTEPCQKSLAQNEVKTSRPMVAPNPVKNILTINSTKKVDDIEVFSISGQKVSVGVFGNKIDFSELPSGTYIIKWSEQGLFKTEKIIKN